MSVQSFKEIVIRIKGEEQTYKKKFGCYEDITLSDKDPVLIKFVHETISELNDSVEVDEIDISIKMDWKTL